MYFWDLISRNVDKEFSNVMKYYLGAIYLLLVNVVLSLTLSLTHTHIGDSQHCHTLYESHPRQGIKRHCNKNNDLHRGNNIVYLSFDKCWIGIFPFLNPFYITWLSITRISHVSNTNRAWIPTQPFLMCYGFWTSFGHVYNPWPFIVV